MVAGQPLLELGDPAALEIAADVLSEEAAQIREGLPAYIEAGGQSLSTEVQRVEPVAFTEVSALGVEEQRVWVVLGLPEASPEAAPVRLGHGYRVRVQFVLWEEPDALRVPTSALFEHEAGWAAFVVEERRARVRPVVLGQRTGLWAEVRGGLADGDQVVTHPGDDLTDGARVSAR